MNPLAGMIILDPENPQNVFVMRDSILGRILILPQNRENIITELPFTLTITRNCAIQLGRATTERIALNTPGSHFDTIN